MRKFPLFIFDLARTHGLGEVDFVVCTSVDYGFVAEFSFVETEETAPVVSDSEMMTEFRNGIGTLLSIKRYNGRATFNATQVRALMRKAYKLYVEQTTLCVGDKFTKADAEKFCERMLAEANRQYDDCPITDMDIKVALATQQRAFELLLNYIKGT